MAEGMVLRTGMILKVINENGTVLFQNKVGGVSPLKEKGKRHIAGVKVLVWESI